MNQVMFTRTALGVVRCWSRAEMQCKRNRATKPMTLGTAFLQKAGYSQRGPIGGVSTHGFPLPYTHNNLFSGVVSL